MNSSTADKPATLQAMIDGLDEFQRAFVYRVVNGSEPVIVGSASAGSGKSLSVVLAIAALLATQKAAPRDIIATTFTSKGAKELHHRLSPIIGTTAVDAMRIGTFHSLALRSLKATLGKAAPHGWLIKACLEADDKTRQAYIPAAAILWSQILQGYEKGKIAGIPEEKGLDLDMKGSGLTWKDYARGVALRKLYGVEQGDPLCDVCSGRLSLHEPQHGVNHPYQEHEAIRGVRDLPELEEAARLYAAAKVGLRAFDFGDVLDAYEAGLQGGFLRDKAAYVFVDEGQDNDQQQHNIARMLARSGKQILVGHASQSIFEWRGAAPADFVNLAQQHGSLDLPMNYRSCSRIVEFANAVEQGLSVRVGRDAIPARASQGTVRRIEAETQQEEVHLVCDLIAERIDDGAPHDSFAILVRTNSLAGHYEMQLVARRIPVLLVSGTPPFFLRWEVQDFLAYAIVSEMDATAALGRILNRPKRFLAKTVLPRIKDYVLAGHPLPTAIRQAAQGLNGAAVRGCMSLAGAVDKLRATPWPARCQTIVDTLSPPDREDAGDDDRTEVYRVAHDIAAGFDTVKELVEYAAACVGSIYAGAVDGASMPGRVTVSTIHRGKGLQWPIVVVPCTEGILPFHRAIKSGSLRRMEEERRLFYVAVTRPEDELWLSYSDEGPKLRKRGGQSKHETEALQAQLGGPSRFIPLGGADDEEDE